MGHSFLFAVGAWRPPHDGVSGARRLDPFHDLASLCSAGSGLSRRSSRFPKQRDRTIAILDIGRVNLDHQGAAIAIDHGVTFVDFRFLAGVLAACRIWSILDAKLKHVA